MTMFFVLTILIGFVISRAYDNSTILYVAIIFSLVMNFTSYWYSDKIALSMYRAKPITREDNFVLWNAVENLSITAGLPMPKVFIIPDPAPNAFATGRNKEHASVAVTSGLLEILNKTELEGVIAHELSHVGNNDILLSTVVVILVGFISILSNIFLRSFRFSGRSRDREGDANAIFMILGIIFAIFSPIVATIIQLTISRKREFLADADGALLTRYPEGLATALEKISGYTMPMARANDATAHLFISSPFGRNAMKGFSKLFMTHPPVEERVAALRGIKIKN